MARRISPHRILIGGLCIALGLAVGRILAVQGLVFPVRVVSGSMAEHLLGEHFATLCLDCGFPLRFGMESPPSTGEAVCPNCGYSKNEVIMGMRERGSRVLIDRAAYLFSSPHRFDLVAFRDPLKTDRLLVKRVVGLPGESVSIRQGDLFVGDQIVRKTLPEFRRLSMLVHDNVYAPQHSAELLPRWRAQDKLTGWRAEGKRFHYQPIAGRGGRQSPQGSTGQELDWLTYHHWRGYASPYGRDAEVPISDNSGYNQGESRELRTVRDILVECRFQTTGTGRLAFRVHDGREWFMASFDLVRNFLELKQNDRTFTEIALPEMTRGDSIDFEFGVCDRQVLVGVQGRELVRQPYFSAATTFQPQATPVSIGSRTSTVTIERLAIRRDVYYLDPSGLDQAWTVSGLIPAGRYLVLGDNPPLSEDSRRWREPTLAEDLILGRVLPLPH